MVNSNLFELFKFSKLLDVKDGDLSLMGVPINIVPTDILCMQQKNLVTTLGIEESYKKIYESAKMGSQKYNELFIKTQSFTDPRKILDWQIKIVTFAGWGKLEIAKIDTKEDIYTVHFKDAIFPKTYGRVNYAVDFIATGFVAGGLSATMKKNLDAVETSCTAKGDSFCEIEVGLPAYIENKRRELWKKWKVI